FGGILALFDEGLMQVGHEFRRLWTTRPLQAQDGQHALPILHCRECAAGQGYNCGFRLSGTPARVGSAAGVLRQSACAAPSGANGLAGRSRHRVALRAACAAKSAPFAEACHHLICREPS
ncbi:hypothetical protein V4C53_44595, partial [Paraburkholderia azotifigens]|uniref:hypothetical protein n=1 Tax=Paraburkholderia azotifigens TaxID=2057004 RepID=UPI0031736793